MKKMKIKLRSGSASAALTALFGLYVGCSDSGQQQMSHDMGPTMGMLSSTVGTSPPLPNPPLDAAIWVNGSNLGKSLVFATERAQANGKLYSYDLTGQPVQTSAPMTQPGLVDIQTGFVFNGTTYDLAAVADSGTGKIMFYSIDRTTGMFTDITGFTAVFKDRSGDAAIPVGVALYRRPSDNTAYVIVSPRSGPMTNYLYQYALSFNSVLGHIDLPISPVRSFGDFSTITTPGDSDVKGLVVDNDLGYVYYSDKLFGIRKYLADPDAPNASMQLALFGQQEFMGDRDGLAIFAKIDGTGYLLSVDQTPTLSRILLWPRQGAPGAPNTHTLAGTLNLNAEYTDGLAVTWQPLNNTYLKGLLAVSNRNGGNFLYYSWQDVATALSLN
jgi:3-phytase